LCQNDSAARAPGFLAGAREAARADGQRTGETVHSDLKAVIELQQVDSRVAELNAQIDALPTEIQSLEAQLNEALHALEDRKARLARNQKERRDLEGEVQAVQARITKHKDQLYEVKTNEQYRAMLREIEGEEAKIRKVEDQILEKMIEAEQLEKQIQDAKARLEGEKTRVADEVRKLQALRRADVEERDQLLARRAELDAALGPSVRELYERIRKVRHGIALAEVREGFCTACNFALRPQLYNEVRTNESLLTCENCDRILYYVPPVEEGVPAGEAAAPTERTVAQD
jgi:hypothetical protein